MPRSPISAGRRRRHEHHVTALMTRVWTPRSHHRFAFPGCPNLPRKTLNDCEVAPPAVCRYRARKDNVMSFQEGHDNRSLRNAVVARSRARFECGTGQSSRQFREFRQLICGIGGIGKLETSRRFTGKECAKSPSERLFTDYPIGFLLERQLHCRNR